MIPAVRRIIDFTLAGGAKVVILTMGDGLFTLLTDQDVADGQDGRIRTILPGCQGGYAGGQVLREDAQDDDAWVG